MASTASQPSSWTGRRPDALGGWPLESIAAKLVLLPGLAAFAAYAALSYLVPIQAGDFTALWSYARLMHEYPPAQLYDPVWLHARQVELGMNPDWELPFHYPPLFLLIAWPFGLLPLRMAYVAWVGSTFAAFAWSLAGLGKGGKEMIWLLLLFVLAAPGTTVGVVFGQTGFLSGALLIGGMRLVGTRPLLGGLMLALLAYKPQFGLLVPVALLAARDFRGIAVTAAMLAALSGLAMTLFGNGIWVAWLLCLPEYVSNVVPLPSLLPLRATVSANLAMLGASETFAEASYALVAALAAGLTWRAFRGGTSDGAIGVLVGATILASPHTFWYDLTMLTGAVLLMGHARLHAGQPLHALETVLLLLVMCLPAAMLWAGVPISLPILLAFCAWAALQVHAGVITSAAGTPAATRSRFPRQVMPGGA